MLASIPEIGIEIACDWDKEIPHVPNVSAARQCAESNCGHGSAFSFRMQSVIPFPPKATPHCPAGIGQFQDMRRQEDPFKGIQDIGQERGGRGTRSGRRRAVPGRG